MKKLNVLFSSSADAERVKYEVRENIQKWCKSSSSKRYFHTVVRGLLFKTESKFYLV